MGERTGGETQGKRKEEKKRGEAEEEEEDEEGKMDVGESWGRSGGKHPRKEGPRA